MKATALPLFSLAKLTLTESLILLYFSTLHADQLHLSILGNTFRFNTLLALLLLGAFMLRLKRKVFDFEDKKLLLSCSLLTASIALSFLLSPFKIRCGIFFGWYLTTFACYFFLPLLFMSTLGAKKTIRLYFLSFLLVGLYALLQFACSLVGINDPFAEQMIQTMCVRPNAFAYEPSYYALYFTPFVMLANLHFLLDKTKDFILFKSLTPSKLLLINFLYLLSTATSAFFGLALLILLLLTQRQFSKRIVLRFILSALLVLCTLYLLFPQFTKEYFLKFAFKHHSFWERKVGIVNAWKVFLEHPIFGVGLGGLPQYLHQAWIRHEGNFIWLYPFDLIASSATPLKFFEPSNCFTEVLASLGLVGFFSFFPLIRHFYRLSKTALKDHWSRIFLLSTLITLILLQLNQGFLRPYIWVQCALCYGLLRNSCNST